MERDGKTLLPQFLGMYRLTVDNVENYMCVMRNVFSGHLKVSHNKNVPFSRMNSCWVGPGAQKIRLERVNSGQGGE